MGLIANSFARKVFPWDRKFTLSLCASKASASKQASKRASVRTMPVVTEVTDSVARREARGLEARNEAAQTVSIALGATEVSHVG